jgi:hypothetical protein
MKLRHLITKSLAALAVVGLLAVPAVRALAADPPTTVMAGLHLVLTTSGYKFTIPSEPPAAGAVNAPSSFSATATLYNRSSTDIPFTFPNPVAAERKFTFRILDGSGAIVWESDGDVVAAQVLTDAKLLRGQRWTRTLLIPLRPGGTALAPGSYSLQAVIDADKKPGAVSIFEVAAPPDPAQEQGINGLVLKPTPPESASPLAEVPAAGANVSVVELRTNTTPVSRPLFIWQGRTDDAGRFSVKTPVGRFRVTAAIPGSSSAAGVTRSVEVTVEAGRYSDVTIHLPAPPTPPAQQGIRGLVLYGPVTPVAVDGVPNERPAVGARVVIEEILPSPNPTNRLPFRWAGVTNAEGRFQALTPAGTFRVTATLGTTTAAGAIVAPPTATAEVVVESGRFSEVTLHIDTGIR